MNQRLLTGAFALAISLALVGAAVTAAKAPPSSAGPVGLISLSVPTTPSGSAQPQESAQARVPFRTASLDDQPSSSRSDESVTPVAVRIGAIGLQATVQSVGVDEDNLFDVPEAQSVGWYKYGSSPTEQGSTVLAAHVDYGGRQGAFFNLADLSEGEELEVELADGTAVRYQVTDNTLYDKTSLPAEDLFRKDGPPVLRLITCGGTFDHSERSYNGNVVVTAVPVAG